MDKITPELAREIFRHIDSKIDLKNLRLVQASFAQLAEEFLFRKLLLEPLPHKLHCLHEIARRPKLARHVREVRLDVCCRYIRTMLFPEFERRLQEEDIQYWDSDISADISDRIQYERVMDIFQACADQYFDFQTSPDYAAALTAGLTRFPRLEALVLLNKIPYRFGPTYDDIGYYRPEEDGGDAEAVYYSQAFMVFVNAAYLADTKLLSFKASAVGGRYCPARAGIGASTLRNLELNRRAAIVFRNCRTIQLKIANIAKSSSFSLSLVKAIEETPLINALSPATRLEDLDIDLGSTAGVVFPLVFGKEHVWPHLRRLRVGNIYIFDHELVGFFRRHKATLREVSIFSAKLESGTWAGVGRTMRDDLQLTSLNLEDLINQTTKVVLDEGYCAAIVNYVLYIDEVLASSSNDY